MKNIDRIISETIHRYINENVFGEDDQVKKYHEKTDVEKKVERYKRDKGHKSEGGSEKQLSDIILNPAVNVEEFAKEMDMDPSLALKKAKHFVNKDSGHVYGFKNSEIRQGMNAANKLGVSQQA